MDAVNLSPASAGAPGVISDSDAQQSSPSPFLLSHQHLVDTVEAVLVYFDNELEERQVEADDAHEGHVRVRLRHLLDDAAELGEGAHLQKDRQHRGGETQAEEGSRWSGSSHRPCLQGLWLQGLFLVSTEHQNMCYGNYGTNFMPCTLNPRP